MKKLLLALAFLALLGLSYADAAMPPTRFHVMYNGSYVKDNVFYAMILHCYPNDSVISMRNFTDTPHRGLIIEEYDASRNCTWYPELSPVMEISCSDSLCYLGYQISPFRLAVYIPSINRTFVTKTEEYEVGDLLMNISSNGEVNTSKMPTPPVVLLPTYGDFIILVASALVLTLVVELITSFVYLHLRKLSKGVLWSVALANIISVPLLWLFLSMVGSDEMLVCLSFVAGEFAVFVFEAVVIFLINKNRMKMADAFAMSFINNLASFLAGIGVLIVISLI